MKYLESMIAWTSPDHDWKGTGGKIEAGPWPDKTGWSDKYFYTAGACDSHVHKFTPEKLAVVMFSNFHAIIIRDGIDAKDAHKAFMKIDEFRKHICPDIPSTE